MRKLQEERSHGCGVPCQVIHRRRYDEWRPILNGDPLAPRPRVLTPIQEGQAIKQAREWLRLKYITITRPQPVTNNLVLVAKKNGDIRVCVDCTPANKVTEDFDWPLPRLLDLRYKIKGNTWFCRLDLENAFFRIRVPYQYRHLTAFKAGGQTYMFTRMPFGLKTAPAVFQRFMDWGLSDLQEICHWYIDDILIYAATAGELRRREMRVRRQLRLMGCTINEKKSEPIKNALLFAGMWVSNYGIGPNPDKRQQVMGLTPPRTKVEAQSALGLVSYLRDFTLLASHFTAMLYPSKEGLPLPVEEYHKEWKKLTSHLASAISSMKHWEEGVNADLYVDASQFALGAVVLQKGKLVAVAARKLTPAETRYSATDREHLALLYASEKLRLILHQSTSETRVWTDHQALLTRDVSRLTARQARWYVATNHWLPRVSHVKGKLNPADFVSRFRGEETGG
jgi:hypothetical protein